MKNILKILLCICVFVNNNKISYAANNSAETTTYAKALVGCNLYKKENLINEIENIYFQIPETYFVIILDTINDNCYKVQYDRYIGYVDASTVLIATFVPIVKTLMNITFDIKTTSGTQIWQSPTTMSNSLTTIAAGTKNVNYIAYTFGSIPSGGESNIWYYVSYTPDSYSTNVYEGYVYSENTTNLSDIVANIETNPEVISNEQDITEPLVFISSTIKTIIISVIVVPIILFFVIILYKITRKIRKNTKINNDLNTGDLEINSENQKNKTLKGLNKLKSLVLLKRKKQTLNGQSKFDDDDLL